MARGRPETTGRAAIERREPTQTLVDVDHDDSFRLTPRKPRFLRDAALSTAFTKIIQAARKTSPVSTKPAAPRSKPTFQRCIVRFKTVPNIARSWISFAVYIARKDATMKQPELAGFDRHSSAMDPVSPLGRWSAAGDRELMKVIISPEQPGADLEKLTRDAMREIETQLGRPLDWTAAIHVNTAHPHVHIALRSRDRNGEHLHLSYDFMRNGFRRVFEDHLTRQLGHRLETSARVEKYVPLAKVVGLDR